MRLLISLLLTLVFAGLALAAGEVLPMGHPDYYPSPERPLGWRGDSTGAWPRASPVGTWDAGKGTNIVWHVDTPGTGLCQPIVAGEKVFITADPNLLCCYSVHDGKLLWQTAIDFTLTLKEDDAKEARAEQAFFNEEWKSYATWRCKLRKVELAVAKASVGTKLTGDLLFASGKIPTLPLQVTPKNYDGNHEAFPERHKQVLALLEKDTEMKDLYLALQDEAIKNGWIMQRTDNSRMVIVPSWPLTARYRKAQEKWNLWCSIGNNWLGYTSYSFATPVTDGKYIYVTSANNAVAAVDYNGKIAWIIWEFRPGRGTFGDRTAGIMHSQYVPSPALLDGKLVVNQMGLLRAYDATNGKKLWEVWGPNDVAAGKKPVGYYYRGDGNEGASPVLGHLPLPDGGTLAVVNDAAGNLWRLDDGKLVCKNIPTAGNGGILWHQESGIMISSKGIHLTAKSRDEVVFEQLWEGATIKFTEQPLNGDQFISEDKATAKTTHLTAAHDLRTGAITWKSKSMVVNYHDEYCSPIVVGGRLYAYHSSTGRGYYVAPSLSETDKGVLACVVADLKTGAVTTVSSAAVDKRCLGDDEFAILNKTVGWGYQQHASPSAQANRLFFRCRGTLWCIGDAKEPFPTPKDCPKDAKVEKVEIQL